MRHAVKNEAAAFEPAEVSMLLEACRIAIERATVSKGPDTDNLVTLVHNIGLRRLQLNRRLESASDASAIADEAVDLFEYLSLIGDDFAFFDERRGLPANSRRISLFSSIFRRTPKVEPGFAMMNGKLP